MEIQNGIIQIILFTFVFVLGAEGPAISSVSLQNEEILQRTAVTNMSKNMQSSSNHLIPFDINIRRNDQRSRRMAVSTLRIENIFQQNI